VVAISSMVKVEKMKHLYRVRRVDFVLALVALLSVLTFETLQALLFAVIISLFALVWYASHPKLAVLGRAPNSLDFSDVRRHPENQTLPGLLMVRPENGLFFANAVGFREAIMQEMRSCTEPVNVVLVDLGATTDLDVPSVDMLMELHKELKIQNVRLILARVIAPVRAILERAGAIEEIGSENIFINPTEAVLDFLTSQYHDSDIQGLVHTGLLTVRIFVQARLSTAPAERRAALAALAEMIDKEIKRIELDGTGTIPL
jgi:SulP family sulfate permease